MEDGRNIDVEALSAELSAEPHLAGRTNWVLLGVGGFGAVFRVDHGALGRSEAVKVLWRPLSEPALADFRREAQLMGSIGPHPAILAVYDTGVTTTGRPYLIAEYAPNGSLADRIAGGQPLPWQEAVDRTIAVADGLQRAHDAGVLHLDIKPANILIDANDQVRLADFGVARTQLRAGASTLSAPLSETGIVGSTIAFTPPELLEGKVTAASDVYMLAATLHALCCGIPPFPRPIDLASRGIPGPVAAAVDRALEVDPALRPQSAAEFADSLRRAAAAPPDQARRRLRPLVAGALGVAAVALLGTYLVTAGGGDSDAIPLPSISVSTTAESPKPTATTASVATTADTAAPASDPGPVCDREIPLNSVEILDNETGLQMEATDVELRSDNVSAQLARVGLQDTITSPAGEIRCVVNDGEFVMLDLRTTGWPDSVTGARGSFDDVRLILRTSDGGSVDLSAAADWTSPGTYGLVQVAVADPDGASLHLTHNGVEESAELSGNSPPLQVCSQWRNAAEPFVSVAHDGRVALPFVDEDGDPGQMILIIDRVELRPVTPDRSTTAEPGRAFVWFHGLAEFESGPVYTSAYEAFGSDDAVQIVADAEAPVGARKLPTGYPADFFEEVWFAEVPCDTDSVTMTVRPGFLVAGTRLGGGWPNLAVDGEATFTVDLP